MLLAATCLGDNSGPSTTSDRYWRGTYSSLQQGSIYKDWLSRAGHTQCWARFPYMPNGKSNSTLRSHTWKDYKFMSFSCIGIFDGSWSKPISPPAFGAKTSICSSWHVTLMETVPEDQLMNSKDLSTLAMYQSKLSKCGTIWPVRVQWDGIYWSVYTPGSGAARISYQATTLG